MNILEAFTDWNNIVIGLMMVGSFALGAWMGGRFSKKRQTEWPTPYPREAEHGRREAQER